MDIKEVLAICNVYSDFQRRLAECEAGCESDPGYFCYEQRRDMESAIETLEYRLNEYIEERVERQLARLGLIPNQDD